MADEKDPTKMTATEANAAAASSGNSAPAKAAKRTLLDALKNGESLYTLRFKGIRGMQEVNILASSAEKAEQVGRGRVDSGAGESARRGRRRRGRQAVNEDDMKRAGRAVMFAAAGILVLGLVLWSGLALLVAAVLQ